MLRLKWSHRNGNWFYGCPTWPNCSGSYSATPNGEPILRIGAQKKPRPLIKSIWHFIREVEPTQPVEGKTVHHYYARILERVVDLTRQNSGLTFGQALQQAETELGVKVPEDVAAIILMASFKVWAAFPTKVPT